MKSHIDFQSFDAESSIIFGFHVHLGLTRNVSPPMGGLVEVATGPSGPGGGNNFPLYFHNPQISPTTTRANKAHNKKVTIVCTIACVSIAGTGGFTIGGWGIVGLFEPRIE